MSDDTAIRVQGVSKTFRLPHEKNSSIKGAVLNFYKRKKSYEKQQVLDDLSFEVKKGEFFGIVGRNGSGKSTLLKLLAGIYSPAQGSISVNGKLTPFIELGVGFNPELTGRENVFLNSALLGFNRKEAQSMYKDIVDFAELHRFMDQKLKNYSSGMQVRLAFSIAIRAKTEILLIDEVLAVGDALFQQKCFDYFKELKKQKKTVVFVSHDSSSLEQYCDRGILIEKGRIVFDGAITRVVNEYREILNQHEEQAVEPSAKAEATTGVQAKKRWGTQDMQVTSLAIRGGDGSSQKNLFTDDDKSISISVKYKANQACASPTYGIVISDKAGQQVFASNTAWMRQKTQDKAKGDSLEIVWEIPNIFNTGNFDINPAVSNDSGRVMYDWRDALGQFKVRKELASTAVANAPHELRIIE